ncbi:hypothetical protein RFI_08988 [Reticulomyxa filosa]|uniref:Uncharacterized protein n=1 Tax=Reticulomyxa filosa TaxID=46433 RepID=X6NS23_RETFI|nr:hypothetical protein RFI_08988 [Reticulomyxa filosa]|eukprot:ETO28142.1 hypothetical protein RFI_08988 [Reticulomyxa filosa]
MGLNETARTTNGYNGSMLSEAHSNVERVDSTESTAGSGGTPALLGIAQAAPSANGHTKSAKQRSAPPLTLSLSVSEPIRTAILKKPSNNENNNTPKEISVSEQTEEQSLVTTANVKSAALQVEKHVTVKFFGNNNNNNNNNNKMKKKKKKKKVVLLSKFYKTQHTHTYINKVQSGRFDCLLRVFIGKGVNGRECAIVGGDSGGE